MYNYDFTDEKTLYEDNHILIDVNEKSAVRSMLLTDKNILIFNNVNTNNPLNSRGVYIPPEYLLEQSIPLENLNYKVLDNNTTINYEGNEIVIYNFNLEERMGK